MNSSPPGNLTVVVRLAALAILLASMLGPWLIDSHPATEENCQAPLIYHGDGLCACLVTFAATLRLSLGAGQHMLLVICLPPLLPFLSTALLMLGKGRRGLWVFHLTAWGVTALLALFFFIRLWLADGIFLWGSGLGGTLAVVMLAGEVLAARVPRTSRQYEEVG